MAPIWKFRSLLARGTEAPAALQTLVVDTVSCLVWPIPHPRKQIPCLKTLCPTSSTKTSSAVSGSPPAPARPSSTSIPPTPTTLSANSSPPPPPTSTTPSRAAAEAWKTWRLVPAPKRAEILYKTGELLTQRKEQYARDMTREMGKVLAETRGDVQEAIDTAYYMAGEGRRLFGQTTPSELKSKFAMSVRMPVGVCGMIAPVELPDGHPLVEALPRARLRQHLRHQARRGHSALAPITSSSASSTRACPPESSTSSPASDPTPARPSSRTPASAPSPLPDHPKSAASSARRPPPTSNPARSRWAARTP